ncbi:restriction endonuclease [Pseudoalteromonas peptidolytica]|uniref:restriction endonuclease n=1 Tax=Pseudoalteromonas peptidolytica TaxID=61150 RepID=UPI00298E5105|nr:restriction endonuclease [Pseudoalteromonas peptidolytica]MDW7549821.1 restriction endonuclease [Pseudoalteromonas peptidolytica]
MPKRTNEYQKLILAINKHFASESATVTESAMLYDPSSEQDREIDILIEQKESGYDFKIGVECTTVKRPLTVGKLDEIIAKHKECGINKTVIVSKSGFASTTKTKAKKLHVQLISYEAALEKDWPAEFSVLSNIKPYHISCDLLPDLVITLADGSTTADFDFTCDPTVTKYGITLSVYLMQLLAKDTNEEMLPPYLNDEKAVTEGVAFTQNWGFDEGIVVKDSNGKEVELAGAKAKFIYRQKALSGDMHTGIYNGQLVCSSVMKDNNAFIKESRFTVSKSDDGDAFSGISVSLSLDTVY